MDRDVRDPFDHYDNIQQPRYLEIEGDDEDFMEMWAEYQKERAPDASEERAAIHAQRGADQGQPRPRSSRHARLFRCGEGWLR